MPDDRFRLRSMDDMDVADTLSKFTEAEAMQLAEVVAEAVQHALGGLPMRCELDPASGVFVLHAIIPDGRTLH